MSWIDWQIFYSSSLNTDYSYRDIFTYLQWKETLTLRVLKTLNSLCNTGKNAFKSVQVFILGEKQNKKIFLLHCNYCPNF